MSIKKILWASDGSKESLDALRWVEMFASRSGARLIAISVVESSPISGAKVSDSLKDDMSLIDGELITKESERLRRIGTMLKQKGIEVETRVAKGVPYQEIIKAARSQGADLIAMGKRGLNLWSRMFLWERDDPSAPGSARASANRTAVDEKAGCEKNCCSKQLCSGR